MANLLMRMGLGLHTALYRLSGGRLLGKFGEAPVLLLKPMTRWW